MKKTPLSPPIIIIALMILIANCDENDHQAGPILPPPPLVANAGNDTTIYLPFNSTKLVTSGSIYQNINSVSFAWRRISGPASVWFLGGNEGAAFVHGMINVGDYAYELSLTDKFDFRTSKDTIRITIAEPPCTNGNGEVILRDLAWDFSWIMEIDIYDFFTYLPLNSFLKKVSIKRDSSGDWEIVDNVSPQYAHYPLHYWDYGNGVFVIFPSDDGYENDTPDIKLEYCY